MTDIAITAGDVVPGANAQVEHGTAGATIAAGQVVYRDASTGQYLLADADSETDGATEPRGIALNGASDGQPLAIARGGDVTIGGTLTAGTAYYLSSENAGGIAPVADLGSGDDVVLLGLAKSTAVLAVDIQISGATL